MDITPLHPLIVGEVAGLDLRAAIDSDRLAELIAAMDKFGALIFRGQSLNDDAQIRFSKMFGPLETTRRARLSRTRQPSCPRGSQGPARWRLPSREADKRCDC